MLPAFGTRRLVCALCTILTACFGLAACGDVVPGAVVAQVGNDSITKETLDRWTAIEAVLAYETNPTRAAPRGVVPDPPSYVACIAYLETTASPAQGQAKPTDAQLKKQCEEKHELLQHHILDILIISYWLSDEAAEKGVRLTNGEIKEVLHRIFPTSAALRHYLSITGERPSDERLIIEKDLLDSRLLQIKEREFKNEGLTSAHQREQALIRAATEFTKKWAPQTSCRAGYVVSECRQYKGPRSLIAP